MTTENNAQPGQAPGKDKEALKQAILEAYRFRHAAKSFDPDRRIDPSDFEFILETGRLSPSSFGFEPWKFVILQNASIREKLAAVSWGAGGQLPTASHFVLILSRQPGDLQPDSDYIRSNMKEVKGMPDEAMAGMEQRYRSFLNDDFGLTGNDRALFEWGARQSYLPLANMMTAAAEIGIDSCPIEGFNKAAAERILAEEGVLDPKRFGLSCMVAFGYRKQDPTRPKTRRPLADVAEWV